MSVGQRVIEWHLQFTAHYEMGLIGIYRPAFLQEVRASSCGIQENKPLSEHMDIDDLAYAQRVRRSKKNKQRRTRLTICLGPIGDSKPQLVDRQIKHIAYEGQWLWTRWLR